MLLLVELLVVGGEGGLGSRVEEGMVSTKALELHLRIQLKSTQGSWMSELLSLSLCAPFQVGNWQRSIRDVGVVLLPLKLEHSMSSRNFSSPFGGRPLS